MLTLEDLKKRIQSTEDLQSVVKTMKALAAVNIRQDEKALEALEDYTRAIEMGLEVLFRERREQRLVLRRAPVERLGAIVFGSDQGLCGPLNEQVASYAAERIEKLRKTEAVIAAVGERVASRLEDAGIPIAGYYSAPTSVTGITPRVQDLLLEIERWQEERELLRVFLFYNIHPGGSSYRPHHVRILPVDEAWLQPLKTRPWPTKVLPTYTMNWDSLFSALIREYLFMAIFRAFAESLASENASRLASMQAAEKNIEDQLAELKKDFHQTRQMTVTEELLDIVSGFEALTASEAPQRTDKRTSHPAR